MAFVFASETHKCLGSKNAIVCVIFFIATVVFARQNYEKTSIKDECLKTLFRFDEAMLAFLTTSAAVRRRCPSWLRLSGKSPFAKKIKDALI